jgi:hypothetical protein
MAGRAMTTPQAIALEREEHSEEFALWPRVFAALGVALYFGVGFNVVAMLTGSSAAHTLQTSFDDAIPLIPWTVYLYSWVFTSAFYPAFVIRSPSLFRRVVMAYMVTLTLAYVCYAIFPVTSTGLRADPTTLNDRVFDGWALRLIYFLDPPYNLCPSLHLAIGVIAALSAGTASRRLGWLAAPIALSIAISICTTKQHFIADGIGGVLVAGVAWWFTLRGVRVEEKESNFGLRGALLYVVFHCLFYGSFYVAFRLGLRPWG